MSRVRWVWELPLLAAAFGWGVVVGFVRGVREGVERRRHRPWCHEGCTGSPHAWAPGHGRFEDVKRARAEKEELGGQGLYTWGAELPVAVLVCDTCGEDMSVVSRGVWVCPQGHRHLA